MHPVLSSERFFLKTVCDRPQVLALRLKGLFLVFFRDKSCGHSFLAVFLPLAADKKDCKKWASFLRFVHSIPRVSFFKTLFVDQVMDLLKKSLENAQVILDVRAQDLRSIFHEAISVSVQRQWIPAELAETVEEGLLRREQSAPTAIGHSVSIVRDEAAPARLSLPTQPESTVAGPIR